MVTSHSTLYLYYSLGDTGPASNGISGHDGAGDDFLTRERAALGDDAAQFASADDNAATVEDGDDDLLGGGGGYGGGHAGSEEITKFESSFPAMDTRNQVSLILSWASPIDIEISS